MQRFFRSIKGEPFDALQCCDQPVDFLLAFPCFAQPFAEFVQIDVLRPVRRLCQRAYVFGEFECLIARVVDFRAVDTHGLRPGEDNVLRNAGIVGEILQTLHGETEPAVRFLKRRQQLSVFVAEFPLGVGRIIEPLCKPGAGILSAAAEHGLQPFQPLNVRRHFLRIIFESFALLIREEQTIARLCRVAADAPVGYLLHGFRVSVRHVLESVVLIGRRRLLKAVYRAGRVLYAVRERFIGLRLFIHRVRIVSRRICAVFCLFCRFSR